MNRLSQDENLSALFGIDLETEGSVATPAAPPVSADYFDHKCRKCGGSGKYDKRRSCFACDGTGMVRGPSFRMVEFAERHPQVAEWINANRSTDNFAESMAQSIAQYGSLTTNQLAACERNVRAPKTSAPTVSTDKLMAAFDAATSSGLKRPKLRFDGFQASLAPMTGKNPGAVYLKDGEIYLGKIAGGKFMASRDASSDQIAVIIATMADPLAAAVAFGKRTGMCSCCGAELTNSQSIERGIGPICAEKFGF